MVYEVMTSAFDESTCNSCRLRQDLRHILRFGWSKMRGGMGGGLRYMHENHHHVVWRSQRHLRRPVSVWRRK